MLILTRRIGATLMIGDNVKIQVLEVKAIRCVFALKLPRKLKHTGRRFTEGFRKKRNSSPAGGAIFFLLFIGLPMAALFVAL